MTIERVVELLGLTPLEPEGGYFAQTYRAAETIKFPLPGHPEPRALVTSIYYLITKQNFSRLHLLKSTEIYHFYFGQPVELNLLNAKGDWEQIILGDDLASGQRPQFVVPPNVWQAVRMRGGDNSSWSLLGTVVTPGFEFDDFRIGNWSELTELFPQHGKLIQELASE